MYAHTYILPRDAQRSRLCWWRQAQNVPQENVAKRCDVTAVINDREQKWGNNVQGSSAIPGGTAHLGKGEDEFEEGRYKQERTHVFRAKVATESKRLFGQGHLPFGGGCSALLSLSSQLRFLCV